MKRLLLTSALPYANGYIHLGHCAGAYLPADIYARYSRLAGKNVLYVCGSDEHGVAITIAADKEKVTPGQIIDKYHAANKEAFEKFGMSFDIYSRTSTAQHHRTAKEFFADFLAKGLLAEKEEDQFYDSRANMFLPDRYVEGTCPNCGYDHARGDQCDSCGAYYDQLDLKNPRSLVSGEKPEVRKTTHWYMKFNELQPFLESYIESHAKEWKDNVIQQTRSWLKQGLAPRAITRDLDWGVKLDGIEGLPADKARGKALYVWFDAVLGYISITKEYTENTGLPDSWKEWWQSAGTEYIAFIGKDNIVFHTLIFPAMLHARGNGYILPENVPANEFLNLEGQKFSKSRNWSIDLRDFCTDFPQPQYTDALRYTLAMNFPESKDSDFTWKDFQARNNNELSAIYGNFVNRTLQFINKNFGGSVPSLPEKYSDLNEKWKELVLYFESCPAGTDIMGSLPNDLAEYFNVNDLTVIFSLWAGNKIASGLYSKFRFRDAITETMNIARAANKYFNDEEPWKTAKANPGECAKTLYICSQLVNSFSILFAPIVPNSSKTIAKFLYLTPVTGEPGESAPQDFSLWESSVFPLLRENSPILSPELLFLKIEDDVIARQVEKLGSMGAEPKEETDFIEIDDFKKVKLRIGKVLEAANLPKSKKLIKMIVDIGTEKRQVLAGVAEYYKPEELIGRSIVVVANLKPAKLMGAESQGMMLAASDDSGNLCFVAPERDIIKAGGEVR